MKSLTTCLMLTTFLCCQCRGQSPQQHLAYAVDASIAKMETLSQKFEELGIQLNMKVEDVGTQINIKFEELHDRMTTIEDIQRLEQSIQGCSSREQVSDFQSIFTDIQRLEQSIQGCSSREQVSDFQRIFTDECADGTHNCSTFASCKNTILHYQCSCHSGYLGNGFTCEDVDECSTTSANRCHSKATCTNTVGNYTCSCTTGFSGDGFNCEDDDECSTTSATRCHSQATCTNTVGNYTCSCTPGLSGDGLNCEDIDECSAASTNRCHNEATCTNTAGNYTCSCTPGFSGDGFNCEVPCRPPSKVIESLGCVIPVKTWMLWEDAKENCNTQGGRLLEGITTQSQLNQLKQHFSSVVSPYYIYVGMQRGKWIETGKSIGSSSPLWGADKQDADYGFVFLEPSRPYIGNYTGATKQPSLCQVVMKN